MTYTDKYRHVKERMPDGNWRMSMNDRTANAKSGIRKISADTREPRKDRKPVHIPE